MLRLMRRASFRCFFFLLNEIIYSSVHSSWLSGSEESKGLGYETSASEQKGVRQYLGSNHGPHIRENGHKGISGK